MRFPVQEVGDLEFFKSLTVDESGQNAANSRNRPWCNTPTLPRYDPVSATSRYYETPTLQYYGCFASGCRTRSKKAVRRQAHANQAAIPNNRSMNRFLAVNFAFRQTADLTLSDDVHCFVSRDRAQCSFN